MKLGLLLFPVPRLSLFLLVVIPIEIVFGFPRPYKSCVHKIDLFLITCGVIWVHQVSVV